MELLFNNIFLTAITFVTILVTFMFWERLTLKMKSELIRKHEMLMNNNQLANLGLLSGGIAHELNNPLTIVQGFNEQSAKLLRDKKFDFEKLQDQIEKQARAIERVTKIVKAFQSMALDQTEGEKIDEDINEIAKDVHRLSKGTASNLCIDIKLKLSEKNCFVKCHRSKIAGAMVNILDNAFFALKSTPSPEVTISTRCDDDFSYIFISNNGPPIHPDLAKKIMVPYFTTKKVSSGTGLGLSLSSRILEDHGGELIFDSQASLTTFILKLPLTK